MAQKQRKQRGVSWELVGIVALLAIFGVGILIWAATSAGGISPPEFSSLNPATGPVKEPAGTGTPGSEIEQADDAAPAAELPAGVTEDGRPYLGSADAKVTIYEFADFQCPHCKQFTVEDSKEIKLDYLATGKAKLVFVNFPFLGDESVQSAQAAVCANEQGKFWGMHDWLFANQALVENNGGFSRNRLRQMAEGLGLDTTVFDTCMDDPATKERVIKDRDYGGKLGVDATPSFLIDDNLLKGPKMESLREGIDKAVAAAQE